MHILGQASIRPQDREDPHQPPWTEHKSDEQYKRENRNIVPDSPGTTQRQTVMLSLNQGAMLALYPPIKLRSFVFTGKLCHEISAKGPAMVDDAMGEVGTTKRPTNQRVARPEPTGSRPCMVDSSMKRGLQE
jgi:hypothetical protein